VLNDFLPDTVEVVCRFLTKHRNKYDPSVFHFVADRPKEFIVLLARLWRGTAHIVPEIPIDLSRISCQEVIKNEIGAANRMLPANGKEVFALFFANRIGLRIPKEFVIGALWRPRSSNRWNFFDRHNHLIEQLRTRYVVTFFRVKHFSF